MAVDKKISQLTSLAQVDVSASTDVLPIVDTSATETKKITVSALVGAGATAGISGAVLTNGTINSTTIGATTPSTGAFTTLSASGNLTLSGGTANGVLYLNGSKVATSGSGFTFSSSAGQIGAEIYQNANLQSFLRIANDSTGAAGDARLYFQNSTNTIDFGLPSTGFTTSGLKVANTAYLYFDGANGFNIGATNGSGLLKFYTGGTTERMRIDSSGNVGIGTASPAFASGDGLEVQRAADATVRVERTGATASAGEFVASSGLVKIGATSGSPFTFITDNTERMRIDSSGNVGIGTTTIGAGGTATRLQVANANTASVGTQANLMVTTTDAQAANVGGIIGLGGSVTTASPTANMRLFGAIRGAKDDATDGGTNGYMAFYTMPSSSVTATERMRIDSSGNVLVGITSATSGGGVLQISNGITFPATQSASSNANTLDDYEEGTWTPTLKNASSSSTFTSNTGRYTKIGRLVYCSFVNDSGNTGTAGSDITLSGLPFAYGGTSNVPTLVAFTANGIPAAVNCYLSRTINGSTSFVVRDAAGNALTNQLTFAAGTIIYEV